MLPDSSSMRLPAAPTLYGIVLVLAAVFFSPSLTPACSAQTLLSPNQSMYARVVRISHAANSQSNGQIVATVTGFAGGNHVDVYGSSDGGATFSVISTINDPNFAGGLCCGTLFELPQTVGSLAAGTLVWAGSVGQNVTTNRRMQIEVYTSSDEGHTWTYNSAITSPNTGGFWEPQFAIASDGALVMTYSDESQEPTYSQLLAHTRTYNGTTWQDTANLVASTVSSDRPGMAVVNTLSNGTYFMTYELCGPAACTVSYKTSTDGWNYGDITNTGTAIRTPSGQFFEHAPTNAVLPNGTILLVGQVLLNSDGSTASGNGDTLFVNSSGTPAGAWSTITAPVSVPGAYSDPCPNYSSPLLPSTDGSSVLEFASNYSGSTCLMYYNSGPTN